MKKFLRNLGIFTGLFAISFSAALLTQYYKGKGTKVDKKALTNVTETEIGPISDKQRVLNSLLEIKAFDVNGGLTMIARDNKTIGLDFYGKGDISNLEDIKLQGNIDVDLNKTNLKANFAYFDNEIFFDYNESYFKLETSKVMEFMEMLPTYGVNVSLPTEIEELDLGMVESYIDNMSEKQTTPDGKNYYFTLPLSEQISIQVITDLDLNFTGIKTDTIDYNGMLFKMNVKLNRLESVDLVSPKNTPNYSKYQDFAPAFKLFDGIFALTKKKQNTINVDLDINKVVEGEEEPFIGTNVDLIYDLESAKHTFGLNGSLSVSKKNSAGQFVDHQTPYSFAIYDEELYAHYGDVAIRVKTDSLTALLQFIGDKIGDEKINDMLSSLTSTISSSQIVDIAEKAGSLLGTITLTSDELDINLNTSNFSTTVIDELTGQETPKTTLSDTVVAIKFNSSTGALESISIKDFAINSYVANVCLSFGEYRPFQLDAVNYQSIDHLFGLANAYDTYAEMTKFRIEFDATVSKDSEIVDGQTVNYKDINIDGGLQFELDPLREEEGHINVGYGYGNLSITDRKDVKHNLKVDMKNVEKVYLSYSTVTGTSRDSSVDPMNVKFKIQTLKDLVEVVSDLVKNPDDHFNELVGTMLNQTTDMPIREIIDGDYLQLLATNLIDRFEVGADYVEFDVAMDIIGMEGASFTCRIEFTTRAEGVDGLKAIKIRNLSYEGLHIDFDAYLKDFDNSLEATRLSEADTYMDLSDLKVLLQLGINTSKNNYYHFTAMANVGISLFGINFDLPLDVKVWTDHGDVKVSIDLTDIPIVVGVNKGLFDNNSDRTAHLYYHDKTFFVNRTEYYTKGILWGKKTHKVEHIAKYDVDGFLDNVLDILCGDVLCLNDTIMKTINDSIEKNNDPNYKMKYENILNDFAYSKSGHFFYFDINLAEIANNDQMKSFTVNVLTDNTDTNLTGINAALSIGLLGSLSINLTLNLTLSDCSLVADASNNLVALDAFEARMAEYPIGYKNTIDTVID